MRTSPLLAFILSLFALTATAPAQMSCLTDDPRFDVTHPNWWQRFTPAEWNASSFATPADLAWFTDARYGMFIHFGMTRGQELGWGVVKTRKLPDSGSGPIDDAVWQSWPKELHLEKFDAKEWVRIAQESGFRYIVLITKHHDGFHLWDTAQSDFKITNTPFGRDQLKEVADACHAAGMRFGVYYSQRDWHHPDYAPVDPANRKQPGPTHQAYIDYQFKAVRELCTRYGKLDIFWWDASYWNGMFTASMWDSERLNRMVRELQPGIIINNRCSIPGDFDTPENRIGDFQDHRPWETAGMLAGGWCWTGKPPQSLAKLMTTLSRTAGGDGNLLLSWGPRWDGSFDPLQIERQREIGAFLRTNGEAYYGTRGGPWMPTTDSTATRREATVYVHVFKWTDNALVLPPIAPHIVKAEMLTGGQVAFSQDAKGVTLTIPAGQRDAVIGLVKLTCDRELTLTDVLRQVGPQSRFASGSLGEVVLKRSAEAIPTEGLDLDLGAGCTVTGIRVRGANLAPGGECVVSLGTSATEFTELSRTPGVTKVWESVANRWEAGAEVPGRSATLLRVQILRAGKDPSIASIEVFGRR